MNTLNAVPPALTSDDITAVPPACENDVVVDLCEDDAPNATTPAVTSDVNEVEISDDSEEEAGTVNHLVPCIWQTSEFGGVRQLLHIEAAVDNLFSQIFTSIASCNIDGKKKQQIKQHLIAYNFIFQFCVYSIYRQP